MLDTYIEVQTDQNKLVEYNAYWAESSFQLISSLFSSEK